jgi:membrane protein DedA with SNARE-associated domain
MVGDLVSFFALRFLGKSLLKELQSIKPKSMQMQNVLIIYHHTCVLFLSQDIL